MFIHDPRIKGPARAWLYATPGSSAARHSAGKGPLYWPDLPQPAEETDALFTASIECVGEAHVMCMYTSVWHDS